MSSCNLCGMHAIDRLTEQLGAFPYVRGVFPFGSHARGSAGRTSDIDLAVDTPGVNSIEWQSVVDTVDQAETLVPIDVVRLDQAGHGLRERVRREGKILYER